MANIVARTMGCLHKVRYDTWRDASAVLRNKRRRGHSEKGESIYRCQFCHGYHFANRYTTTEGDRKLTDFKLKRNQSEPNNE